MRDQGIAHSLAVSLRALNLCDATLTVLLYAIAGNADIEANPFMRPLLGVSIFLFAFVKVAVVAVASEFLARQKQWAPLAVFNLLYLGAVAMQAALLLQ